MSHFNFGGLGEFLGALRFRTIKFEFSTLELTK